MSGLNHPDAPNPPSETIAPDAKAALHTRRAFLFKLSVMLNAAVGAVLAVPPDRGSPSATSTTSLSERRDSQSFVAPLPVSTTARQRRSHAGCDAPPSGSSRFSPSTARTSDARCAGSHNQNCSCAPAMAARTTKTAAELPGHPNADSSNIAIDSTAIPSSSTPGTCPRSPPRHPASRSRSSRSIRLAPNTHPRPRGPNGQHEAQHDRRV